MGESLRLTSPLHVAAYSGDVSTLKELIEMGGNSVDDIDEQERTPLVSQKREQ